MFKTILNYFEKKNKERRDAEEMETYIRSEFKKDYQRMNFNNQASMRAFLAGKGLMS